LLASHPSLVLVTGDPLLLAAEAAPAPVVGVAAFAGRLA
jgi:hypothetical protein